MAVYSCRSIHNGYRIVKFDSDFNVLKIYILKGSLGYSLRCDCPRGYMGKSCHHASLVLYFAQTQRVDKGYFYDEENDVWHLPLTFRRRVGHD